MEENMMDKLRAYFAGQPVKRAWLFGSMARGEQTPASDVDILVDFDEGVGLFKYSAMVEDLERIVNRAVDLVGSGSLFPWVKPSVEACKIMIYERKA